MAALDMFSKKGYEGTNIRELSASLGLVKSGIYKHYESKEAIWNALLDRMIAYYGEHFGSAEHLPPVPDSPEDFVSMTMRMVNLTVRDEQIVMTRKVLTLEQYRDERARDLATKHFLTGLAEMFTRVFSGMMDKGLLNTGRSRHAGLRLHDADLRPDPPVRPGAGEDRGGPQEDRGLQPALYQNIRKRIIGRNKRLPGFEV